MHCLLCGAKIEDHCSDFIRIRRGNYGHSFHYHLECFEHAAGSEFVPGAPPHTMESIFVENYYIAEGIWGKKI